MDKGLQKTLSGPRVTTQSKPDAVRERLREVARKAGAGAKLPGAAMFCRELQISPNTLSKALAELETDGLIERRNGVGVFVRVATPSATRLALICDPNCFRQGHSPFWDQMLDLLHEKADEDGGFEMHFAEADPFAPLPIALAQSIEAGKIGGVLAIGLSEIPALQIMESGVPLVNLFGKGHVIILTDVRGQIEICLREMMRRGCKKLALWMNVPPFAPPEGTLFVHKSTRADFCDVLAAHHLDFCDSRVECNPQLIGQPPRSIPAPAEQGFQLAHHIFEVPRESWPDGVFINNDLMAHGVLMALRQLGVRVGEDVHLATQTNTGSPLLVGERELITAEINPADIAQIMFEHLNRLREIAPDQLPIDQIFDVPAQPGAGISAI